MPQLPLLPGNTFNPNEGKDRFHKSHHFDYTNDVAMLVGDCKPGIGGEPLLGQNIKTKHSVFPKGEGSTAPAWVAFDRQVLCFDAFFQEAVHEKREEQYRVRRCKIYFYLEDDSIQVIEPHVKNSGIPQGTLIRRHRINLPGTDDEYYTVDQFNVGETVELYERKFKLTDCDEFTKSFLTRLGVKVLKSEKVPEDPYTRLRDEIDQSMQPLRPYERLDKLKQFLEHDRHVLRFHAEWDDKDAMFGDNRKLVIHYFLADDTIEIREIMDANSGRDSIPVFLKRAKLPKMAPLSIRQPGETTDRTVLNVFGPMGHGGRYILDSLKTGAVTTEYYTDADIMIGGHMNIWGRDITITDADEFTKEFYKSKYGVKSFAVKQRIPTPPAVEREIPPYTGIGSEEDSLRSCMGLIPKPPQRDFIKFMEKDRSGLNSNVLRFVAYMETSNPVDACRKFIIFFFLSDDTIAVFEPPQRNSGVVGGKFLERSRIKKPNQLPNQIKPRYYHAKDLYVGASVLFNRHIFKIVDADEYAFRYMEAHADEFPYACLDKIIAKIKPHMEEMTAANSCSYEEFKIYLSKPQFLLNEHEIATLGRHYGNRTSQPPSLDYACMIAQEQLRKKNFEDFTRLKDSCAFEDVNKSGKIPADLLNTTCRAFKLPLNQNILHRLFDLHIDGEGCIDYNEFINRLNWRDHQCNNWMDGMSGDSLYGSDGSPVGLNVETVNLKQLKEDLSK